MQTLTSQGQQLVNDLAQRHGFSPDAVLTMLQAVAAGNGSMAQFNHPEFGGGGQWMPGGMTMLGDMFNYGLKARVDNLCGELSQALCQQLIWEPAPNGHASRNWWPEEFGIPSATGGQNQMRYALFPASRRLVLDNNGQVTIYDTLDHQIGGVSQQQQGYGASVSFSSQYGQFGLEALPVVGGNAPVAPEPMQAPPIPEPTFAPQAAPSGDQQDIFATIERLADLRQKGILSDAEFSQKKAELLSRI